MSAETRRELMKLATVVVQLGLLLAVVHVFRIEESFGFLRITPVILAGFAVHAVMPLRYRLPFFIGLTWLAVGLVLGPYYGAGLVAVGLGLVAICHLPIPFWARLSVLLAAAVGLVAVKAGWVGEWVVLSFGGHDPFPALAAVMLPILGAMFMFRLVVYLYDLRHGDAKGSIWQRLSYFFLLPNVCFPLFPVVDYQIFTRSYYGRDAAGIYQKGLVWMLRGIMHLLLYRVIYHFVMPSPVEVTGFLQVAQYVLAAYLLYLRVSGQFHLIVGILCLFGFDLPETHRLYYLSSGFNDFWRRINIYWKDFMKKVFYYPAFMRLKRWGLGMKGALVGATLFVFLSTWLLHSYQWFWLKGEFPVRLVDALFWGILGVLVVVNSLMELRRGRKRRASGVDWSPRAALGTSARTLGTFLFIGLLWSLWTSPSVTEWWAVVSEARSGSAGQAAILLGALVLVLAVGTAVQYAQSRGWRFALLDEQLSFRGSAAYTGGVAAVLLVVGAPFTTGNLDGPVAGVMASLQADRLNERDAELAHRGYYEDLLDAGQFTSALWRVRPSPSDWNAPGAAGAHERYDDILTFGHAASFAGISKRAPYHTNQWGMRDREYTREKPPGVYRVAFLGASLEAGAGVEGHETLEAVLEDRLNRAHAGGRYEGYEVLNLAVSGYSVLHNALVAERKAFEFEPDAVFFALHSTEDVRLTNHMRALIQREIEIPYPDLKEIVARAGATPDMSDLTIESGLRDVLDDVTAWSFRRIVEVCGQHGITPVAIFVPLTEELGGVDEARFAELAEMARTAGFTLLNLAGAYGHVDAETIQLAPWDYHLSVAGHRLVGEELYRALLESGIGAEIGLWGDPAPAVVAGEGGAGSGR